MKPILICLVMFGAMAMAEDNDIATVLHEGNNQFTARMFSEVVKQNPGKSVVLSAFSVMSPLAQLALASVGDSHDELLKCIGLPNDNVTKAVFSQVNRDLRSIKGVELKMANKVYIPEKYELNDEFATVVKESFDSEVQKVDFIKTQATADEINAWVEDHTNHRIKNLVDPQSFGPDTRAVLVNAIYFKGSWSQPFDKKATVDRDFHVSEDKVIKVPTMYKKGNFNYGESSELGAKLLELYYEGEKSSMLIVVPNKIDGLAELEKKLEDPAALDKAVKDMYSLEIEVYLPKFKIETTTNLKNVLQNMNIKKLFNVGEARLDNLLKINGQKETDLYVSEAIQKAFIEVNEEGAEAAAANEFIVGLGASFNPNRKEIKADRPFYYAIRANTEMIFNGVIYF